MANVDLFERVRAGFKGTGADAELVERAAIFFEQWIGDEDKSHYFAQLYDQVDREQWDSLLDAFYQVIPFGTGGRRGAVGIGPNRINGHTIRSSVQGHAQHLCSISREPSVVIAWDVRQFLDSRGVYNKELPNPLYGKTSRDFAESAATVYAANGVRVYMLERGSKRWISTPELSFAIRFCGATGGLNVSASHNHPDDNGAKIYNACGGQEVPPVDEQLVKAVEKVEKIEDMPWSDAIESGLICDLPDGLHEAYVALNVGVSREPSARSARVLFSPLHGTGDSNVGDVLRAAGFQVDLEPSQSNPDGSFPTVPFAAPNPEVVQSMHRAIETADAIGADLVMACDPDADRLGLAAKTNSGWRSFTGNEIATLVVHAMLRGVSRLAEARGARVVDHLLVGFKYIGEAIRHLDERGSFAGLEGVAEDFLVGVEESHGVLVTPHIRDKDAAGAALILAELASVEKESGRDLLMTLSSIWDEVGPTANTLTSTVMRGAAGRALIDSIQASLRANPPTEVGGLNVVDFVDHQSPDGPHGPIKSGTDKASRNVLALALEGGARLIVRPSGTEPKTKVYAEVSGAPGADPDKLNLKAKGLAHEFVLEMLRRVDIELPVWSLSLSELLSVEKKTEFVEITMPQIIAKASSGELNMGALTEVVSYLGRDALGLVSGGLVKWAHLNIGVAGSGELLSLLTD
jgi:phosphoglucomutase